jgi:hypothetical protein
VWAANTSGGIRLYDADPAYQQYCYANAVFAVSPVTNFTNNVDNITDAYANASNYVLSATTSLSSLNLYPSAGQLTGTTTIDTLFHLYEDWDKDFNDDPYLWTYRGAYAGCCTNNGWQLQVDTMPGHFTSTVGIGNTPANYSGDFILLNPVHSELKILFTGKEKRLVSIYDVNGRMLLYASGSEEEISFDVNHLAPGTYLIKIYGTTKFSTGRIVKM